MGRPCLRLLLGKPTNSFLPQRGIEFGVLEERVPGGRQEGRVKGSVALCRLFLREDRCGRRGLIKSPLRDSTRGQHNTA